MQTYYRLVERLFRGYLHGHRHIFQTITVALDELVEGIEDINLEVLKELMHDPYFRQRLAIEEPGFIVLKHEDMHHDTAPSGAMRRTNNRRGSDCVRDTPATQVAPDAWVRSPCHSWTRRR